MSDAHDLLREAYDAFNERDVDAALALVHPRVDWTNAWEGGRIRGRVALREYWQRQFAQIASSVQPERFVDEPGGAVVVHVRQVVRAARTREMISDSPVRHRYGFEDGLIVRMDVLDPGGGEEGEGGGEEGEGGEGEGEGGEGKGGA